MQKTQRPLAPAAVVDDAKAQGRIIGLLQQARDAGLQKSGMIAGRDDRRHLGRRIGQRPRQDQMPARSSRQLGLRPRPVQVLADQLGAGRIDARLGVLREAAAARKAAPVIEHVWNVQDRARPALGHPQHQIVVLRALEALADPAQAAEQRGPHGEGVVHIVLGEQPLAVEVGLEARLRSPPVRVDGVLVGVDGRGVGLGGEGVADQGQGVGRQQVVMIEEKHHLPLGKRQGRVGRLGDPLGLGMGRQADARIGRLGPAQQLMDGRRAGAVVGDAKSPCRIDLGPHRIDGLLQVLGLGIVHRHDHRDAGQVRSAGGPGPDFVQLGGAGLVGGDPGPIVGEAGAVASPLDRRPGFAQRRGQGFSAGDPRVHQPAATGGPRGQPFRQCAALVGAIDADAGRPPPKAQQPRPIRRDLRGDHRAALAEGHGDDLDLGGRRPDQDQARPRLRAHARGGEELEASAVGARLDQLDLQPPPGGEHPAVFGTQEIGHPRAEPEATHRGGAQARRRQLVTERRRVTRPLAPARAEPGQPYPWGGHPAGGAGKPGSERRLRASRSRAASASRRRRSGSPISVVIALAQASGCIASSRPSSPSLTVPR